MKHVFEQKSTGKKIKQLRVRKKDVDRKEQKRKTFHTAQFFSNINTVFRWDARAGLAQIHGYGRTSISFLFGLKSNL